MDERLDAVVVGAGQSGLAASYYLSRAGLDHAVLERGRIAEAWRSQRWDKFCLVTPNWSLALPGWPYTGEAPDAFMAGADFVAHLEAYARSFRAPVRTGVEALRLGRAEDGGDLLLETDAGQIRAADVVVATSTYQSPRRPAGAEGLEAEIGQVHVGDYRNTEALPDGAVLVVGSGQSGCQIADELNRAGRRVYLSVGDSRRLPRRYRGRDAIAWQRDMGYLDLRQMAAEGVELLGRFLGAEGTQVSFRDDLAQSLIQAEAFAVDFCRDIDTFVALNGIEAPSEPPPTPADPTVVAALAAASPRRLDLRAAGIASVIWATGFGFDFGWIELPIVDRFGYPATRKGVSTEAGLYFVGLNWMHKRKSGIVYGVAEDAEWVVRHLAGRRQA
ncbi:MAG: NAD(P)-binding domain-containing protein [Alphaproteobacteria bacterium]|jgi:putative flavoprotein involved in K+ transport|nr:NAD(P)-binding domain-containing protein [Alphaproteobacteria bacterium]